LGDIKCFAYGSFNEFGDFMNSGLNFLVDISDGEILFKTIKCVGCINQRLGKATAFYESLADPLNISFDRVLSRVVKVLKTRIIFFFWAMLKQSDVGSMC
jgi:hypothetical protein